MEDRSSNEDLNAKPNFRLAVIVYIILTNSVKKDLGPFGFDRLGSAEPNRIFLTIPLKTV